jgi:glycosyltransferase involved in cell wall biosynthesis
MPPQRTGVADYSAALARELSRHAEVLINPPADAGDTAAVDLYHIGNNPLHAEVIERARTRPGVVVLHDAVLQHFLLWASNETGYIDEFVHNYGEWHRDLGRELWSERATAHFDRRYFEWPMLRGIVEWQKAIVVHNAAAAVAVQRHLHNVDRPRIVEIPHLFDSPVPPSKEAIAALRSQWGASATTLVVGVFGYLRETKRLPVILRAVRRLREAGAGLLLVIAGEFVSQDLGKSLAADLAEPGVVRVPFLSEADFWVHAHAVDVCANLRVPSAGESSGIATRLMGIGKAVLLTDGPEIGALPEGTYFPVDAGEWEEVEVYAILQKLCERRGLAAEIGEAARHHIQREHALPEVARRYLAVLAA